MFKYINLLRFEIIIKYENKKIDSISLKKIFLYYIEIRLMIYSIVILKFFQIN